jgi:putative spermidine/putrescine transport system substrate-binding protein
MVRPYSEQEEIMNAQTIHKDMTIKQLLEQHPSTLEVLIANGFDNLKDPTVLAGVGGFLKLERAARTKNYDLDNFLGLLQQKVDEKNNQVDVTMKQTQQDQSEITISGLLPCPVRLPLLEGFDRFIQQYSKDSGVTVSYKFEAASLGSAWMEEHIQTVTAADQLPDIFVSAGFETFFDPRTIGHFKDQGLFSDLTGGLVNKSFDGLDLKDPKGHYGLISVVPAALW